MLRNVYLRQAEDILDVTDADRFLQKKIQDAEAGVVRERSVDVSEIHGRRQYNDTLI
jgi:hypothetical protein